MISVFISYSHKDETLRNELETHLALMRREGVIGVWHDRRIVAGKELDKEISESLEAANVILLLVSPDFLASDYCYEREMERAIARHDSGQAAVIPVILRPCDWHTSPFGKLRATPRDGKPITTWPNLDEAFLDVVRDIRQATTAAPQGALQTVGLAKFFTNEAAAMRGGQRSSNLRIKKTFTEADRDRFVDDSFEFIARFFENSLAELKLRNQGIETAFKRIDANMFTSAVYQGGKAVARCRIFLGGGGRGGKDICYGADDSTATNSMNESMTVSEGDQLLGLRPAMSFRHSRDEVLTAEGAAEHFWEMFIEALRS